MNVGFVLRSVLENPTLTPESKATYALLSTYRVGSSVTNEELANGLGCTVEAVQTWMGELFDAGVLIRKGAS